MKVTATAPGTTANLGPGFDCLGAALSLHVQVTADTGKPGDWSYGASETDPPPPDLILRAIRAIAPDADMPGLRVETDVPLGRGLGSSAAAVACGLLIGAALTGEELGPPALLAAGLPIEGHPDNLAPALWGGVTVVESGGGVLAFEPHPAVRPVVLVPQERLATAQARRVLPEQVPFADAVANVGASSGLVAVLSGAVEPTPERLLACTADRLHQAYRAPLMAKTERAIETLRDAGVAAFVSGAGPSVGCLVVEETRSGVSDLEGWDVLELDWDLSGAHVVGG